MIANASRSIFLLGALALMIGLAGCGRKGDPLRPSEVELSEEDKAAGKTKPETYNKNKKFILDPLLQ
ncbi:MAG: lipoprotein [Pseudomonadota bacterium]